MKKYKIEKIKLDGKSRKYFILSSQEVAGKVNEIIDYLNEKRNNLKKSNRKSN